jgi:hypothetical protein
MDTATIVGMMCSEELSQADIQAICKNRGFAAKDAASTKLLENLLMSETGVVSALAGLSWDEILLLYYLKALSRPIELPFFERVYRAEHSGWSNTFTQRYGDTFKKLRIALVRRGILFFCDPGAPWGDKRSKLERLIFVFPTEFHPFLPPLFKKVVRRSESGEVHDAVLRSKLQEVFGKTSQEQNEQQKSSDQILHITDGELCLGDKGFRLVLFRNWQRQHWAGAVESKLRSSAKPPLMNHVDAVSFALSQLGLQEWAEPVELTDILSFFCHGLEPCDPVKICEEGWKWGCLARIKADESTWYRLPQDWGGQTEAARLSPGDYLIPESEHGVAVDLSRIPYASLETLAQLSRFSACDPTLWASPHRVKISRLLRTVGREPLALWLKENAPEFGRAFVELERKWGHNIVHQDIAVAEVKDLSLRVALEKAFSGKGCVSLPGGFLAFPKDLREQVEALVVKSGYVVKRVVSDVRA